MRNETHARLYAGPLSRKGRPSSLCSRWGPLANVNYARWGTPIGEDEGCFEAALEAVRKYGGVLEHPANSIAWRTFSAYPNRRSEASGQQP